MKIFLSLFLLFILLISLNLGVDESAMELQDEALTRSFTAFGLAKALNAVISLLQGTELSFTPVGVGLNFSVGEVLDPFNDMVERFSWVMLFATVSLGIQKILLILSAKVFLQVFLGISIVGTLLLVWVKKLQNVQILSYMLRALLLVLLLRFSAILFVYSSQLLYTSTLQTEYEDATKVIEKTQNKLEDLETKNRVVMQSCKDVGFFDGMSNKYEKVIDNLNISKQLSALEQSIEEASSKIVELITIFIVQSVIFPLLYFWLMLVSVKLIFRMEFNKEALKLLYNDLK
jgi:hypothetical protein